MAESIILSEQDIARSLTRIAHEVAERERMEEALLESERIRVLAETAGAAAHEINQPLMVIMGLVQLLQKQQRGAVPPPSDLETIYKQAERIEEIVKKMGAARQYAATDYVGETRIIDFDEASKVEDEEEPPPPG